MDRRTEFKVFAGNSNPPLAKEIGRFLRVSLGKLEASKFANGETSVLIHESIRSQDVYIVQSTCANLNQINYVKHSKANKTKSPTRRSMSRSNSGTNVSRVANTPPNNATNNPANSTANTASSNATSTSNTANTTTTTTTTASNNTGTDIGALITTAVNTILGTTSTDNKPTTKGASTTNVEDTFVVLTKSGNNEVTNNTTTNTHDKNNGTQSPALNQLPVPELGSSVSIGTQTGPTPPISPLPIPAPAPTQTPSTPFAHSASASLPPIPVTPPPASMRGPIPVTPLPSTPTHSLPQTPAQTTPLSAAALLPPTTPIPATPPPATPTQAPPQTPKSPSMNPTSQISPSISPRGPKPEVIISHSTSADADLHNWSVNDSLMELLIMGDAFKRASCKQLVAVIPFFGYARQSKKHIGRTPITAKLVANMLQSAGFDRVITVDLHASQIQGFFDIPVDNLYAEPSIVKYIRKRIQGEKVVVAPGVGGVKRAKSVADKLDLDLAILHKETKADTDEKYMVLVGDVKDKVALIIDDIADTCETLELATYSLVAKGAKEVYALVTHGVLSDRALERLNSMPLKELVITNTIPNEYNLSQCPKLKVINLGHLLGEAIRRTNFGESLSTYFFT